MFCCSNMTLSTRAEYALKTLNYSYTAEEAHPEIVETAVLFLQDKALLPNKSRRVQTSVFVHACFCETQGEMPHANARCVMDGTLWIAHVKLY